jgi:type II secretory pathway pseudopilin PulG
MRRVARGVLAVALAVVLLVLAGAIAREARASEARHAVEEANAALSQIPADRNAARATLARAVAARDDADAVAEAQFLLGRLDEDDAAFPSALGHYRDAIDAGPNTRWAQRASDRVDWLRARSEGDFAPLARLEHVRRDPALASDPAAIEALARDAESFPPGQVRVEARMLVAEAWLGRLHRPAEAVGELRSVCDDPHADALTSRLAARELVDAIVADGRLEDAVSEAHRRSNRLDPRFVRQIERLVVRRELRRVALVEVALFLALVGAAVVRARRRGALAEVGLSLKKLAPLAILFVLYVAGVGGMLASNYESGNATPFLLLGAAALPLVIAARAWGAVGSRHAAARVGRAILCGTTMVGAAFLLLDTVNPAYLEGFGL